MIQASAEDVEVSMLEAEASAVNDEDGEASCKRLRHLL